MSTKLNKFENSRWKYYEVFAETITRTLSTRGYICRQAPNVEKAQTLIQSEAPDYAILDLNLNGESSLQLIPILRLISSQREYWF